MFIFADHGIRERDYYSIKITSNYLKEICKPYVHHHFCLGHDIHISRLIIFDMLNNDIINNEDILIVTDDRQFLYNHIFPNIFNYKNFIEKYQDIINKENLIFLPKVVEDLLYFKKNDDLLKFNYDINNEKYWNKKLVYNIQSINKFNVNNNLKNILKNNKYIIFIVRSFAYKKIKEEYISFLKKINENKGNLKLLVFCEYENGIDCTSNCNYIINNIHEYVTLLQYDNCVSLIGETSGLLELSYYYHHDNLNVLQFSFEYKTISIPWLDENQLFKKNIGGMIQWNKKYISPIKHYFFKNFDDLINEIKINFNFIN